MRRLTYMALALVAPALFISIGSLHVDAALQESGAEAGGSGQPWIRDPYHHISGVVVYPPSQVSSGNPLRKLVDALLPPIFGPNIDTSLNNPAAQNETTIDIDPDGGQRVIASANDYRNGLKPWVYLSTDAGTSWTNYQVPGLQNLNYGDPAMAFGRSNHAYFTYLGYQSVCGGAGGMYVSHSSDGGTTFSTPYQLAANSNTGGVAVLQDKEYVAVDNNPTGPYAGNAYAAWTRFAFTAGVNCGQPSTLIDAPIIFSRTTDNGLSWSVPITASPPISNNNQGALPVVGRNSEVYLYYMGAQTTSQLPYDTILFSRSTDGGQTFPFFTHIASIVDLPSPLPNTNFRVWAAGAMAADKQIDGYIYAVWADYRTGDADILMSRSTDNGTTWGPPQRVNDDPLGNGKDQFFPWVATSPDGKLHVSWFDRRDDPGNTNYHEYYTDSLDHGATFEPNVRVSTALSFPGGSSFIGDYSGLAATNDVVMPIWTDIRENFNQNAYVAQGIFPPVLTPTATSTETATSTATATATSTSTVTPTICPIEFVDVPVGHTFYGSIKCLACRGIVSGYSDGTFRPNNQVTRGQLAKMVSNAAGFNEPVSGQTFADVPPSHTFYAWIERLTIRGYMSGYVCGGPGEPCINNMPYFRPFANATRGQTSKIVSNTAGFTEVHTSQTFQDVPPTHTFYQEIERLASRGVMGGYPCGGPGEPCIAPQNRPYFRPGNDVTRGQSAKIVANTFFPDCFTP